MSGDEDAVIEVHRQDGTIRVIHVGLDLAMKRAKGAFLDGRIDADEFEREVERILRKMEARR